MFYKYNRIVFLNIVGFVARCKFTSIWLLAESGCILSGFSYNETKEHKNRLRNVDWVACETSQSLRDLSNSWNLSTNNWLRHYVYDRVTPPGEKPTSRTLAVTYITSSIWHGFYPGYYALFIPFGIFQGLSRRIRRTIRPLLVADDDYSYPIQQKSSPSSISLRIVCKMLYDIMGYVMSMTLIAILTVPFDLLHVSKTLKVWSSIYYIHIWGYISIWAFLAVMGPTLLSLQKKRSKKGEATEIKLKRKTL